MAWTEDEVSEFQKKNAAALADVNASLRPDPNLTQGKVGIFLFGQAGDVMTAMSVLHYRDKTFPGKQIIWFANHPNADCLRYAPISEVRPWPWAGNGLPEGTPDFWPMLMTEDNRLNASLSKNFDLTRDLDDGYFPAPYMLPPQKRHGIDYPNCSRKVFGVPADWEWHPLIHGSPKELESASKFVKELPKAKTILFETFAGSDQSKLSADMVADTMTLCRQHWDNCNFIFASHKFLRHQEEFPPQFFNNPGVYSAGGFTVRQCGFVSDQCDLIISVSSGITVAASSWSRNPVPIIQFCGSWICSTQSLAAGRVFELVTADGKQPDVYKTEFFFRLNELLIKSK